ncbi:MAG: alpha/beta fold hydrolase [Verrucomicrobia bacterium]|nr:alpha/beta fold hydrolase [Verrucomicrobiota bacterium]MBS0636639.1 alpha/beta fold hydrolase [Verrucomicrobiota bacterium]
MTTPFHPLPFLSSPHLQTILGSLRRPPPPPPSFTLPIHVGNDDFITCECSTPPSFKKIVVLVHGLGGSHASPYMIRIAKHLFDRNIMAVRMNLRSCGSAKGLSKLPYHAGRSQDLLAVLELLQKDYPAQEVNLVGFSLGANIALKLQGELGSSSPVTKTLAINPPLDLAKAVRSIQKTIYHRYYLKSICKQAGPWLKGAVESLYDFDDKVTGPIWGFSGADDYYNYASSCRYISAIKGHCKILFSEDDPFITKEIRDMAPYAETTRYGGHMGYLGYTAPEFKYHWLDEYIINNLN